MGKAVDCCNWTAIAGPYWRPFATAWAACWDCLCDRRVSVRSSHLAGWGFYGAAKSLSTILTKASWTPSGKRDVSAVALRVASGIQPSRRALPTLLPEGLGKDVHLKLALSMQHPFTLRVPLPQHCEDAVREQLRVGNRLRTERHLVVGFVLELQSLLMPDAVRVVVLCHPDLVAVLEPRNVPLMRELTWCVHFTDFTFLPHLVLGLRIVGWADNAPRFTHKVKMPECDVPSLLHDVRKHNQRIVARATSSGDLTLDLASLEKTRAEFESGSLVGPYYSLRDMPFGEDSVRLLRRFPIRSSGRCMVGFRSALVATLTTVSMGDRMLLWACCIQIAPLTWIP